MALKSYCKDFSENEGINVRYMQREVPRAIPPEVALCLYRITQESLRNVSKHAGVRRAAVALAHLDGGLRLTVSDAGLGFDCDQVKSTPGLGLRSMMERVRLLEGAWRLKSRPGHGTRITVHIPLSDT